MNAARSALVASTSAALLALLAGCAGSYQSGAAGLAYDEPNGPVDVSLFYDSLSPWGRWIDDPTWGWCWTPLDVSPYWRPYEDGSWADTDYGWTWISNEPWGWATYHYGRWTFDPAYGWLWVPDTVWGPAWVAWRSDADWIGWAPLPPGARWEAGFGLRFHDFDRIPPSHWSFVDRDHLSDRKLKNHLVSVTRNVTLLSETKDHTHFDVRDGIPLDRGVDVKNARHLEVASARSPGDSDRIAHGRVAFFRPRIEDTAPHVTPPEMSATPSNRPVQDRKALETYLTKEQTRMSDRHRHELAAADHDHADTSAIRQRHEQEKQAFANYAAQQRHAMDHRGGGHGGHGEHGGQGRHGGHERHSGGPRRR